MAHSWANPSLSAQVELMLLHADRMEWRWQHEMRNNKLPGLSLVRLEVLKHNSLGMQL